MRVTLSIDDDVLSRAREIAQAQQISVGKALSELARRGIQAPIRFRLVDGFPIFDLPPRPLVSLDEIERAKDQEYRDELAKCR